MAAEVMTPALPTTRQAAHKLAGACIDMCRAELECPDDARAARLRLYRMCVGMAILLRRADPTLTLEDRP